MILSKSPNRGKDRPEGGFFQHQHSPAPVPLCRLLLDVSKRRADHIYGREEYIYNAHDHSRLSVLNIVPEDRAKKFDIVNDETPDLCARTNSDRGRPNRFRVNIFRELVLKKPSALGDCGCERELCRSFHFY